MNLAETKATADEITGAAEECRGLLVQVTSAIQTLQTGPLTELAQAYPDNEQLGQCMQAFIELKNDMEREHGGVQVAVRHLEDFIGAREALG